MLVLTRRRDQRILIGDDIVIKIVRIQRDRVSIGFEAPDNVPIVRAELLDNDATMPGAADCNSGSGSRVAARIKR